MEKGKISIIPSITNGICSTVQVEVDDSFSSEQISNFICQALRELQNPKNVIESNDQLSIPKKTLKVCIFPDMDNPDKSDNLKIESDFNLSTTVSLVNMALTMSILKTVI